MSATHTLDAARTVEMTSAGDNPDKTQLALDRTWLAHERTLMAWVRTAASQISFGFTIYKFFQFDAGNQAKSPHAFITPRDFAVLLVSISIFSLLAATIQHRKEIRRITPYLTVKPFSLAGLMAWLISGLGILALIAAAVRR